MADLAVKEFIPYQYEDILTNVKNRFYAKGYTDVENEGSNAFKLSAILSGVLSNLSFNANANIQEMFLSSAYNENNIVKGASFQGYERVKNVSYQYEIKIRMVMDSSLPDNDTTTRSYIINRFDSFMSNGNVYYYMGDPFTIVASNNDISTGASNSIATITVKEGTLYKYSDISYLTHVVSSYTENDTVKVETSFEIPLSDIEEDGVDVYVTYSDGSKLWIDQKWNKSNSMLIENTSEKRSFIVLEEISTGTYKLYWKFSGTGIDLSEGSIVKCHVLTSKGSSGISNGVFSADSELYDFIPGYQVLKTTGLMKESKTEISSNAPRFNNSANRAVVRKDYVAISNRRSEVGKTGVWGSEDEIPKYRKSAFLSFVPSYINNTLTFDSVNNSYNRVIDDSFYLTSSEISDIFTYFKDYSIPSLKHESRQPLYIDFNYNIEIVSYNPNKSVYDTNAEIYNSIKTYFLSDIEQFNSIYFHSNLIATINDTTTYISGITCNVDYNIPLSSINLDDPFEDGINYRFVGNLSYPYKYPFDNNGTPIVNYLPNINTTNWLGEGYDLVVDYDNSYYYNSYITYNIKYNDIICGKYIIVKDVEEYIRIELYVTEDSAVSDKPDWILSPLKYSNFNTERIMNLKYINDNFTFFRNAIGRLNQINFILN